MKIQGINQEKCIKCGQCINECPARLYSKEDDLIEFDDPEETCILCGHCLAVCPTDAVIAEESDVFAFEEARDPSQIINYDYLMRLFRARRSTRQFKAKEIPKDQIEKILEAMRYAPSGSNLQAWNYIVITNREKIKYFSDETVKLLILARKALKLKFILRFFVSGNTKQLLLDPRNEIRLDRFLAEYKSGKDVIFYDAPCVIVLHSPKYGSIAGNDAGIALTHGMFAAQSLGIGTCWIGFAQEAARRKRKLRKWLGIPKGRTIWGVLALGYPSVQFHRAPPRKELHVEWME
jgi:nitroreductase/NAD-dependent dihydropyrimidine dehydrogenase PreA subunit